MSSHCSNHEMQSSSTTPSPPNDHSKHCIALHIWKRQTMCLIPCSSYRLIISGKCRLKATTVHTEHHQLSTCHCRNNCLTQWRKKRKFNFYMWWQLEHPQTASNGSLCSHLEKRVLTVVIVIRGIEIVEVHCICLSVNVTWALSQWCTFLAPPNVMEGCSFFFFEGHDPCGTVTHFRVELERVVVFVVINFSSGPGIEGVAAQHQHGTGTGCYLQWLATPSVGPVHGRGLRCSGCLQSSWNDHCFQQSWRLPHTNNLSCLWRFLQKRRPFSQKQVCISIIAPQCNSFPHISFVPCRLLSGGNHPSPHAPRTWNDHDEDHPVTTSSFTQLTSFTEMPALAHCWQHLLG